MLPMRDAMLPRRWEAPLDELAGPGKFVLPILPPLAVTLAATGFARWSLSNMALPMREPVLPMRTAGAGVLATLAVTGFARWSVSNMALPMREPVLPMRDPVLLAGAGAPACDLRLPRRPTTGLAFATTWALAAGAFTADLTAGARTAAFTGCVPETGRTEPGLVIWSVETAQVARGAVADAERRAAEAGANAAA